jgi:hypothetical protein
MKAPGWLDFPCHRSSPVMDSADTDLLRKSNGDFVGVKKTLLTTLTGRKKPGFQAKCTTPPCKFNFLTGAVDTAEEAARVYLQHWQEAHQLELADRQAKVEEREAKAANLAARKEASAARMHVPNPVAAHLLMRSDRSSTGYQGVVQNKGRYKATCDTAPCRNHHLGRFSNLEEAAQAYLQHHQEKHGHGVDARP